MRILFASALLSAAATALFSWIYSPTLPLLAACTLTNAVISSVLHHSHAYPYFFWHLVDKVCVPIAVCVELCTSTRREYTLVAVAVYVASKQFDNEYLPGGIRLQQGLHALAHVVATVGHILWFKDLSSNK